MFDRVTRSDDVADDRDVQPLDPADVLSIV